MDAKPRRKYRITEADRERRAIQINKYGDKGRAAAAARPPEERSRSASFGGKALYESYRAMKDAFTTESPESIRARRKQLEGKRDELLDHLLACAAGSADLQADLGIIKAALAELRPEIGLLIDREERAKAAGPPVPTAPRAPIVPVVPVVPVAIVQPAPRNPPPENPAADISPPISPD